MLLERRFVRRSCTSNGVTFLTTNTVGAGLVVLLFFVILWAWLRFPLAFCPTLCAFFYAVTLVVQILSGAPGKAELLVSGIAGGVHYRDQPVDPRCVC